MALTISDDQFGRAILIALQAEIDRAVDEEIEAAKARVEQKVRHNIASIAASLHDHYSIERMGRDLVIRVKHEGPNNDRA